MCAWVEFLSFRIFGGQKWAFCAVVGLNTADFIPSQSNRLPFIPFKLSTGEACGLRDRSITDSLELVQEIGVPKVCLYGPARRAPLAGDLCLAAAE